MPLQSTRNFSLSAGQNTVFNQVPAAFTQTSILGGIDNCTLDFDVSAGSFLTGMGASANTQFIRGIVSCSGDIAGKLSPNDMTTSLFVDQIFQNKTSTAVGTVNTHVYDGQIRASDVGGLSFNITLGDDSNNSTKNAISCYPTNYSITKGDAGENIEFSSSWVGVRLDAAIDSDMSRTALIDKSTPGVPTTIPFNSTQATMKIKAGQNDFTSMIDVPARAFNISIDTGFELQPSTGSFNTDVSSATPQITCTFNLDKQDGVDAQQWYAFLYTSSNFSLEIELGSSQIISGTDTYKMIFKMPNCVMSGDPEGASTGDSTINQSFTLQALDPSSPGIIDPLEVTVVNGIA